jgi:hypothetical protein
MPEIVISDVSEPAHQAESTSYTDPQPESAVLDPDPVPEATGGPEEQQLSPASSLLVPPETADQSAEVTSSSSSSIDGDAMSGGGVSGGESGPVVSSEPDNSSKYSPAPGSCGGEDPVLGPLVAAVAISASCRRFEKRKRDQREDSLDSTHTVSSHHSSLRSSSGGGGLYNNQSDTGSVQSHRFSTISISSNVSSDVSFGNASAVSGSSCYLASMSSADFDDRPALASSFSLSEAEENEYLSSQYGGGGEEGGGVGEEEGGGQQREEEQPLLPGNVVDSAESSEARKSGKTAAVSTTNVVKKDQLSPPRPDGKLPALPSADRHKLRSLFRRSNDGNNGGSTGRSKNSSYESRKSFQTSADSRSREGGGGSEEGCSNGGSHAGSSSTASNRSSAVMSAPRSRIGTGSSLTPATSLEQTTSATTCVEQQRCSSSSFEDEMRRSLNREEDEEGGNAVVSATDSEDSAEAGGSLTHHRYYHVFREGEIDHMIEKYVENLHIIRSYYDHANWCVVAEKVNVWTI